MAQLTGSCLVLTLAIAPPVTPISLLLSLGCTTAPALHKQGLPQALASSEAKQILALSFLSMIPFLPFFRLVWSPKTLSESLHLLFRIYSDQKRFSGRVAINISGGFFSHGGGKQPLVTQPRISPLVYPGSGQPSRSPGLRGKGRGRLREGCHRSIDLGPEREGGRHGGHPPEP